VNHAPPRRLIHLVGWLLTPVAVWAASFFGGWMGALVPSLRSDDEGLVWMIVGAVLGGTLGLVAWVVLMRRVQRPHGEQGVRAPGAPHEGDE
jgi:hypothetical protein